MKKSFWLMGVVIVVILVVVVIILVSDSKDAKDLTVFSDGKKVEIMVGKEEYVFDEKHINFGAVAVQIGSAKFLIQFDNNNGVLYLAMFDAVIKEVRAKNNVVVVGEGCTVEAVRSELPAAVFINHGIADKRLVDKYLKK